MKTVMRTMITWVVRRIHVAEKTSRKRHRMEILTAQRQSV